MAPPFTPWPATWTQVLDTWLQGADTSDAVLHFRSQLDACRHAAATVYSHLDAHGISVDLVFRLRQLRERVLRVRALLDCLLRGHPARRHGPPALAPGQRGSGAAQRAASISSNSSLLAAKVAERSSETGEHYITRTRAEYRAMLGSAAGGGALTAADHLP